MVIKTLLDLKLKIHLKVNYLMMDQEMPDLVIHGKFVMNNKQKQQMLLKISVVQVVSRILEI